MVTVMSTVPTACAARSMTLIEVELFTVKHGAVGDPGHGVALMLVPTYTLVALNPVPLKPVPVTVIPVLPAAGPAEGDTPVTVGTGAYVYWSAPDVGLVPPTVVTVMSTVPVPAGRSFTLIEVALVTVKHGEVGVPGHGVAVIGLVPMLTCVALKLVPLKSVPLIVIPVPPTATLAGGDTPVTVGTGAYVYWSAPDVGLVPPTVVTVMSTVPVPAGRSFTLIEVALVTVKHGEVGVPGHGVAVIGLVPMLTCVALKLVPLKSVPLIVIPVPPTATPACGDTPVTVGTGAYVYWSAPDVGLVPPTVVTVTSTAPVPAGRSITLIEVAPPTVKHGAIGVPGHGVAVIGLVPILTCVALKLVPLKSVPLIVIPVPPAARPACGDTLVTVGTGAYVYWSPAIAVPVPTVTSTVPDPSTGVSASISVSLTTVKHPAADGDGSRHG